MLTYKFSDGTTDTTRTTHFGTANDEEKDAYTRVLLGNLDVERVVFPNDGTYSGADIDVLARRHLWEVIFKMSIANSVKGWT